MVDGPVPTDLFGLALEAGECILLWTYVYDVINDVMEIMLRSQFQSLDPNR